MPSAASHETLVRQLQMLQLIPRSPAQVTVADLTQSLADLGFPVTSRTVQRDLNDIALVMPLECNDKSKPFGWKWSRDAKAHLPMMSLQEALTLHLVNKHLAQILPPNMLTGLSPMFKQAEQTINSLGSENQVTHWLHSVVVESPSQPMLAPTVLPDVQRSVYQAIFEQKQLKVCYQSVVNDQAKEMILHPLGLIQRGKVSYLGATVNDYEDIRLFAMHRFSEAQVKELDDAKPRNLISWQDYLASGAGGFNATANNQIKLTAWVEDGLAALLEETPLCEDQQLEATTEGMLLTATLFDTWQLQWWILSQGARIVVQEPATLRTSIQSQIEQMRERYHSK
ncbi:MAG: WYL domain-containing protein [Thiotrichales bacterium]|nr:WYL domain-containing protein [Thiotrichales bacterium]